MSNIQRPFWLLVTCFDLDRSEVRSNAISKDLWEANGYAQIECFSCNVSQSLAMERISWWPFSPPRGEKYKHQEWKNKNACQAIMSNGSTTNRTKRMCKHVELWHEKHMEYDVMNEGVVKLKWKASMISIDTIHVQVRRRRR